MFQGTPTSHSFQHPSTVSALRADPPSPTRGEGKGVPHDLPLPRHRRRHRQALRRARHARR
ncbi:hypothetical protein EN741_28165, partial [Mesorhizobium sp. M4B.F.Ca.ET.019.03.1.1]